MAKIYTKTGDKGSTGLVGGHRVSKNSPRLEAYGTVDELNSVLGIVRALARDQAKISTIDETLERFQNELFNLGSRLACADDKILKGLPVISEKQVTWMEKSIDQMTSELTPLKNFILPGGHLVSAQLHFARTVCRRAERLVVGLQNEKEQIEPPLVTYLNRLSDHLFVLARWVNHKLGDKEVLWSKS